jgi:hypothetical protein
LAGFAGPRAYTNNGSAGSTTWASNFTSDGGSNDAGNNYYNVGSGNSQGASSLADTGLYKSNIDGHSWAQYCYINSVGDGYTQGKGVQLDWGTQGGNYGNNYIPDYNWSPNSVDGHSQASAGSALLSIISWDGSGSNTISGYGWSNSGGRSYDQMWQDADDSSLGGALPTSGNLGASDYIGLRITGWSDTGTSNYYFSLWAHIPS